MHSQPVSKPITEYFGGAKTLSPSKPTTLIDMEKRREQALSPQKDHKDSVQNPRHMTKMEEGDAVVEKI